MKIRIFIAMAVAGLMFLPNLLWADTIELKDGKKRLKIQIVEETIESVKFRKSRLPNIQSVPSDSVKDVKYYVSGSDFKTAQEAFKAGDWHTAAKLYYEYAESLDNDKAALRAHCLFQSGMSYLKCAQWKNALAVLGKFIKENPEHRLYPEAVKERAICYVNNKDMKKARIEFTNLKKDIPKKKISDFWKHEVEYWLIFLNEDSDARRALDDYKKLYDDVKDSYPKVANQARLRIGRVLIQQKKYDEAKAFFTEIIDSRLDADRDVAAGAYLGRGLCILSKRNASKEDNKQALFDLLRVVVHYKEVGEHQAEALYYAGKCFLQVGDKDASKRSKVLFQRLQSDWSASKWAQKAAKELGM